MSLQDYYEDYWARDVAASLSDPLSPTRVELLRKELGRASARRVLDVGCGAGDTVAALASDGFEAAGIDISPGAIELATRAHPDCSFITYPVEDLPWPVNDGSVDAIVAFEVIEHLIRPRRFAGVFVGARKS